MASVHEHLQIDSAQQKLLDLQAQLERLRPHVMARWRSGERPCSGLDRVMELDAEIECAAAHLRALKNSR